MHTIYSTLWIIFSYWIFYDIQLGQSIHTNHALVHVKSMADRKKLTALKALDLLQNIQENDSDAEIDIQSCEDVYDSHEDNFDELESEFSADKESLVSESSTFDISDFADTKKNSKTDKDQDLQNNTTSLTTSDGTT